MSLNENPMDELLRILGADPQNPPPAPTRVNIPKTQIPDSLRGPISASFGDPVNRISVSLPGVSPEAAIAIEKEVLRIGCETIEDVLRVIQRLAVK